MTGADNAGGNTGGRCGLALLHGAGDPGVTRFGIDATNASEIAHKIDVAMKAIEEGGTEEQWEIALIQSARRDVFMLERHD